MKTKKVLRAATFTISLLMMQAEGVFANDKAIADVKEAQIVPAFILLPIILFGVWRITHRSGVNP